MDTGSTKVTLESLIIDYSAQQLKLREHDYQTLRDAIYYALLARNKFKTLFDKIEININDTGACIDFHALESYFREYIKQNPIEAISELIQFNRATGFVRLGWQGDALLEWAILTQPLTPELKTRYAELNVFFVSEDTSVQPSSRADIIVGSNANDTLSAEVGDDIIYAGFGDDTIDGDAGNDHLYGNAGEDLLHGHSGNDRLAGGNGDDTLDGGAGYDILVGESGDDILNGGTGYDRLNGNDGDDVLNGDAGYDTLAGDDGDDKLYGGMGYDILYGGNGEDSLDGGDGFDQLYGNDDNDLIKGGDGRDALFGGAGNDKLYGDNGDDDLNGDVGNDLLDGGVGADILNGGVGNDLLSGGSDGDTYHFGRGFGQDRLSENDLVTEHTDTLLFGADITAEQIWLRRIEDDLELTIIGSRDKMSIINWFHAENPQMYYVEQIQTHDGKVLFSDKVASLVQAMSSFSPPPYGSNVLPDDYRSALQVTISQSWH